MAAPSLLPGIAGDQLLAFVLVLSRLGGIFALAPVFSSRVIPLRVRIVVAAALALVLTPLASEGRQLPEQAVDIALALLKETLVGLAFAVAVGAVAAALVAAGELLDVVTGFSYAQLVDPMSGLQSGPLARLYTLFGAIAFLLIGGDHLVVLGLARSYALLPIDSDPNPAALASLAAHELTQVAAIAVEVAAPVLVALLLADVAMALIARAVPQMNVFFVGVPGKIVLSIAVAAAAMPFVARHLTTDVASAVDQALSVLRGR